MNAKQITAAATAELVAFFNAKCERAGMKPVKKFADRKTAERRVAALIEALPSKAHQLECPSCGAVHDQTYANKAETTFFCHQCNTTYDGKGKVLNTDTTALSAGVAASWLNPAVAAARSERTQVLAGTPGAMQRFRSVRQAFRHFNLPDAKHIPFRMAFKAGELNTFGGITFAVAEAA